MTLSKRAIDEYKEIYLKKFGKKITDAEALEQGTKLINMMKVIYKPIPKKDYKNIKK